MEKSGTKLRLQLAGPRAAQQAQQVAVELRYAPAQLEVSVGAQPVLVWNDNRQFVFEHLREQQVGAWSATCLPCSLPGRRAEGCCRGRGCSGQQGSFLLKAEIPS